VTLRDVYVTPPTISECQRRREIDASDQISVTELIMATAENGAAEAALTQQQSAMHRSPAGRVKAGLPMI
jgi:hypothetical protein